VVSKVYRLGVHMLPPAARLCAVCRAALQDLRYGSRRCPACEVARRQARRQALPRPLDRWMRTILHLARGRSPVPCDLTVAYLLALWDAQGGRCFYSGYPLAVPVGGTRDPFSPSLDRLVPERGYTRGNVVWATWVCNQGKGTRSVAAFLAECAAVAAFQAAGGMALDAAAAAVAEEDG
jgi:hypothetical protein